MTAPSTNRKEQNRHKQPRKERNKATRKCHRNFSFAFNPDILHLVCSSKYKVYMCNCRFGLFALIRSKRTVHVASATSKRNSAITYTHNASDFLCFNKLIYPKCDGLQTVALAKQHCRHFAPIDLGCSAKWDRKTAVTQWATKNARISSNGSNASHQNSFISQ